jgi:hypothetical protein
MRKGDKEITMEGTLKHRNRIGLHYENLTDEEIQNVAKARFGEVLRPLSEIGRESVIEELEAYDRFLKI